MKKILVGVAVLALALNAHTQSKGQTLGEGAVFGGYVDSFEKVELTMEEAILGQFRQFYPSRLNQLTWLPGSETYTEVKSDSLYLHSPKGKSKLFLSLRDLNDLVKDHAQLKSFPTITWLDPISFYFNEDGKYITVNTKMKTAQKNASEPEGGANFDFHAKTGMLAYTVGNNLYIQSGGKDNAITKNIGEVVSGQSISRNEYGISKGTFWSNSGNALAFYQKDESQVANYPLTDYKTTPASVKNIKYPMSGGKSELVSVGIYNIKTNSTVYLDVLNGQKMNDNYYLTNLSWSPDDKSVFVIYLNRATDMMRLLQFDATTGKLIKKIIEETDARWVEPDQPITFIPGSNDKFLWYSWKNGYHSYYLYDLSGKEYGHFKAPFEFTGIIGFNTDATTVYMYGTSENATEMHAYAGNLSDFSYSRITPVAGVHEVAISPSGNFILDTYSSLTTPNQTDLNGAGGRKIKRLHYAADPLAFKKIGETSIFTITGNDNGKSYDLYCRMIKPSDFNPKKKYPVLIYVYNGPHVQLVTNSWLGGSSLWMNKLAEEGYIVFTLDGRGSAHRGKEFEQAIHRQLGEAEMEDQMAGVNYLKSLPFVDTDRMAIHGWSFGGFMTTSLMLRQPGVFKVGVAGGPVIDWELYEVMYTERYMDTPLENPQGYAQSRVSEFAKNLNGDLLMIHGTDDDVVVMQHNMRFMKACIDSKVQVDFFAYPGHAHNVRGKDRVHLMTKVIDYIKASLE